MLDELGSVRGDDIPAWFCMLLGCMTVAAVDEYRQHGYSQ